MTVYSKFFVALFMALVAFLRDHYNIDLGIDEEAATALVGLLTALLVYLIPNGRRG